MLKHKEYIILGGGPAALQLGYYFQKLNNDYLILEKNDKAASFFNKYPHSGELISINKRFNGNDDDDFNMRHDWNSLCNDYNLKFKDFSKEYYPKSNDLVKYMNHFAEHYSLNIEFGVDIKIITKKVIHFNELTINDDVFTLISENAIYTCKYLIVATGLSKMNIPENIENIREYSKHYGEFEKGFFLNKDNLNYYDNKRVLIVGNGNSAFEIANLLNNHCSNIMIVGRNFPKLALISHYTGDVRTKYMNFYETFLLKSLNSFDSVGIDDYIINKTERNTFVFTNKITQRNELYDKEFDEIINCTGWKFNNDIFDIVVKPQLTDNKKYPIINSDCSSVNVPNMFFIGSLMHFNDYKLSSGGFIHGFRYLIDNFVKINITDFDYKTFNDITALSDQFMKRINTSSGLYQMYGQLCDICYFDKDKNVFVYYEQVPINYLLSNLNTKIKIPEKTIAFMTTLEYGSDPPHEVKDVWTTKVHLGKESHGRLLHPVLRVFRGIKLNYTNYKINYLNLNNHANMIDETHFIENIFAEFIAYGYYKERFARIVKSYII